MEASHVGLTALRFVSLTACISLLMKAQFTLRKRYEIWSQLLHTDRITAVQVVSLYSVVLVRSH